MTDTRPTAEQVIAALEKVGTQVLREWDTADELDSNYREMSGAWSKKLRAALDLARKWRETNGR